MTPATPKPMIVAGIMSGTSADGIDVALCRISPSVKSGEPPSLELLGHRSFAYVQRLRRAILSVASGNATTAAELARVSWRLGELYAECISTTSRDLSLEPQLIAVHGQTIYHQPTSTNFLGQHLRCTWQIGEPAVIAERLHLPVISDFRPADLAAGGQGAPLVPMLDYCLFRHPTRNRLLLNLGGIANITVLPASCSTNEVLAFDTGPANMIIDAVVQRLHNRRFDKDGATAARGHVLTSVIDHFLQEKYFSTPPPKSCGREEFGASSVDKLLALCDNESPRKQDAIATATALTAATLLDAYRRFCWPHLGQNAPLARATDLFAAGGGANNTTLMRMLTDHLKPLGVKVSTTAATGLPVEAKEAAAFALLGWLTWHHLPGNIPSATGATHPAILGKVTFA